MASSHCSRRLFSISSFKSAFGPTTTTTNHSPLLNASATITPHPPPHRQFSPFFI
ncbi:hypothetical protein A2U01_0045099, partial [Trifolium medium]|nr:hypothetical protein [Trifolium medium]